MNPCSTDKLVYLAQILNHMPNSSVSAYASFYTPHK